jgi:predicted transcriptional regulator
MDTTTIRVSVETRNRLNELARRRGEPAGDVVAALVRAADDRALLESATESWGSLSPDALAAYKAETTEVGEFDAQLPDY